MIEFWNINKGIGNCYSSARIAVYEFFVLQQLVEQRGETEDRLFDSFYDTFIRHQRSQSKVLSLTGKYISSVDNNWK